MPIYSSRIDVADSPCSSRFWHLPICHRLPLCCNRYARLPLHPQRRNRCEKAQFGDRGDLVRPPACADPPRTRSVSPGRQNAAAATVESVAENTRFPYAEIGSATGAGDALRAASTPPSMGRVVPVIQPARARSLRCPCCRDSPSLAAAPRACGSRRASQITLAPGRGPNCRPCRRGYKCDEREVVVLPDQDCECSV